MTQMAEKYPRLTGPKMTLTKEQRDRLRQLRERKGLTGTQLAKRIGVTQGSISNLETGKRHPQVYRMLYTRVVRYLARASDHGAAPDEDESYIALTDDIKDLYGPDIQAVRALVVALKAAKKSG